MIRPFYCDGNKIVGGRPHSKAYEWGRFGEKQVNYILLLFTLLSPTNIYAAANEQLGSWRSKEGIDLQEFTVSRRNLCDTRAPRRCVRCNPVKGFSSLKRVVRNVKVQENSGLPWAGGAGGSQARTGLELQV